MFIIYELGLYFKIIYILRELDQQSIYNPEKMFQRYSLNYQALHFLMKVFDVIFVRIIHESDPSLQATVYQLRYLQQHENMFKNKYN